MEEQKDEFSFLLLSLPQSFDKGELETPSGNLSMERLLYSDEVDQLRLEELK